ncbi:MAG: transcriptional repressor [Opitutales bacterium]|nr:transcriptional repressor [Opitutales bacterium]NRA28536.1 transcriptional repressor [Opitutales bacterium]
MINSADLLKSYGLSVTAQRLAVIDALTQSPHATADEVFVVVKAHIGSISRQSVYNALNTLSDQGAIRRFQPAGSAARFENRVGDNHHHVVCRKCGVTEDVDCAVGYAPCLQPSNDHGFIIDEAEVVYWGICPSCQEEEK